jgi:hypothetical protein
MPPTPQKCGRAWIGVQDDMQVFESLQFKEPFVTAARGLATHAQWVQRKWRRNRRDTKFV